MTIRLEDALKEHPMAGVLFGWATAFFSLFAEVTPLFAAISAMLGALVLFYTFRIKAIEYEMKKAELKKQRAKDLEG